MKKVLFGIDVFCEQSASFKNIRFALVTNNAAINSLGVPGRKALLDAGFNIIKLFSPEHGLTAKGEDGAYQKNHTDALTQLPVVSLYGDHLIPTAEAMDGIDAVLFDIPDVGCRFYTYLWTMTYVMEACAYFNKPFIVLDRPNPTAADIFQSEGPMLDEQNCSSFIGRWNIPVRHCCTLGELAKFFAATKINNLDLQVIKVENWNRMQTATASGWNFVPTSPAIKDIGTALLYPGMGLLEGINVNEGRGTEYDFKVIGAPWINAQQLNEAFTSLQLAGIKSKPTNYIPVWGLYAGKTCFGLQFTVSNTEQFTPVKTGLALLQLIVKLYPSDCTERLYPTVANPSGAGHLDKLTGVFQSFKKLKMGEILSTEIEQQDWENVIQPRLLYQ